MNCAEVADLQRRRPTPLFSLHFHLLTCVKYLIPQKKKKKVVFLPHLKKGDLQWQTRHLTHLDYLLGTGRCFEFIPCVVELLRTGKDKTVN